MKQKQSVLVGGIGIVIGAAIMWTLINPASSIPTRTEKKMVTSIDRHFIEQMIPHHQDAIIMAELAVTRAQKPEVKLLAQNIIDSQSKEITQMKAWYKNWYGEDVPESGSTMDMHGMQQASGMHMGMMGDATDVARLENAADFDRVFVEEMIPHHQMAVMMARMLENGTQREEMKLLADDIINAQTDEIDQMREWLKTWE